MKTKVMETSITSETVSHDTISGKMEGPSKDSKVPETAKEVPRVPSKDKDHDEDWGSDKDRETEIEEMGTNLSKVRGAYFNFLSTQRKNTMVRMKYG